MEQYIVSARKYRPQTFESVVGQKHITDTLENAIKSNHLAQALLFCGPRGVGKTTCARILAKKINEADHVEERDFSLNIFELDAASNNSVDDIRNLIDQVRFAPQVGNYKVYIIDEVHMLSQQAFNAFLKTLEEPPAHAIFILATTEKHKIIPTILSRCQIFDFKRISVEDIAGHLKTVAKSENIEADEEGLHIIAQKADGALRDALSIFDRLVAFNDQKLTYESVIENLDILDYDYFFKATDFILAQDVTNLLLLFNQVLERGFEGIQFINGLAAHFRDLLVGKDEKTIELMEVGPNVKTKYLEQSKRCEVPFLIFGLRLLNDCDVRYKSTSNQRLLSEVTLMQLVGLLEKKKSEHEQLEPSIPKLSPTKKPATNQSSEKPKDEIISSPQAEVVQKSTNKEGQSQHKTANSPSEKPKEEAATPPKKTPAKHAWLKNKKRTTGIALSQTHTGQVNESAHEEEDENQIPEGPAEVFSDAAFEKTYQDFLKTIKHRKSILGVLTAHKPKLKNLTELHFSLENNTQESYLKSIQTEMLRFLREKLNNVKITVISEINHVETERKPYTAEERYLAMVKENPALESLRKALEMEIE